MHESLHGKAEHRLGIPDGVAPCHRAASGGDCRSGSVEDGGDRVVRHVLGKGGDVHCHDHAATHGEHVTARVGGRDGAEVGWIIDERWEEVGGGHHGQVVGESIDRRIVEGCESD